MKKTIEAIGSTQALMHNQRRAERILDSEKLDDKQKLEYLECVTEEYKEIIWFILSEN